MFGLEPNSAICDAATVTAMPAPNRYVRPMRDFTRKDEPKWVMPSDGTEAELAESVIHQQYARAFTLKLDDQEETSRQLCRKQVEAIRMSARTSGAKHLRMPEVGSAEDLAEIQVLLQETYGRFRRVVRGDQHVAADDMEVLRASLGDSEPTPDALAAAVRRALRLVRVLDA